MRSPGSSARALRVLVAALALLAGATALPAVSAQDAPGTADGRITVLVYHPFPDPEVKPGEGGDPFGVPGGFHPSRDRMNDVYGARAFPTVRVDGVLEHSHAANASATSVDALQDAYADLVDARLAEDAPVTITLEAVVDPVTGNLTARATFTPRVDVQSARVSLEMVVFEDDVHYDGGNGITNHRFTVRHVFQPESARLAANVPVTVTREVSVHANWTVDELGVAAFAQNVDPQSATWRHLEVLQSASVDVGADPVTQASKRALVEMYSATWCPPCFFGDLAVEALAEEYGLASADVASAWTYWRAPSLPQLAGAAVLALVVGALVWPRERAGGDAK